ncbi:unnamed protein product [Chondrus crispus]|uniref:Uncharacterized protein n=1 Tax=Chondrus crispus TaxID=2769 RepID=R7QBX3_CHOCR|nr:unnamed protein product [Chondrus crispus]CDF35559.1 unnamed protein product [Chondrus crispus]|eukprot:XP_005715379.1 unnamed protein product [Chondrus crispus]
MDMMNHRESSEQCCSKSLSGGVSKAALANLPSLKSSASYANSTFSLSLG